MIILSYDISDNRLRATFSKYLTKYGHRIQYSVYMIDTDRRMLNNIKTDIKHKYEKHFGQQDSVYIFDLSSSCEITRYGYALNEEKDYLIF